MELTSRHEIVQILDAANDLTLATLQDDGAPQATTVSFVNDGLAIYFGCSGASQKARNLPRDPRVALTINLPYEDWSEIRGLSISGRADRIVTPHEVLEIGRLFLDKFPQVGQMDASEGGLALFCITPQRVSILDYRPGFGHTTYVQAGELEEVPD
jgi:general stress protein 26